MSSPCGPSEYSEHPAFQTFITTVLEEFAFLETREFAVDSWGDVANECAVRFKNATTGIEIRYDMPRAPTVSLARLDKNGEFTRDNYGLKFLMAERCPERKVNETADLATAESGFRQLLQQYASILTENAPDVLGGDFSVFPRLERHVRKEMTRLRRK